MSLVALVPAPEAVAFMGRVKAVEARVAETQGVINAAYGEMVDVLAGAYAGHVMEGWGIHSAGHWVSWQTGCSLARGHGLAKLAKRAGELPSVVAALRSGELAVDAAVAIAKRGPAAYERSITEFAKGATVSQLQSTLRKYNYDDPDVEQPKKGEDRRSLSKGQRDDGLFHLNAKVDADEGAVVDQGLKAALEDLRRQAKAEAPEGEKPRPVTLSDALVAMAEAFLRSGEAMFPGSDRYLVHLHLDANPVDGEASTLGFHLGGRVPDALRSLLLCGDTALRPTIWNGSTPLSVGRKTRTISRRLRRVIEHRDRGCRVPGCGRTHGLEIHHIAHWEHGGRTDTENLVTLCRFHHRTHHQGLLAIAGNPEHVDCAPEAGEPLRFTDQWGRTLDATGTPIRPQPGQSIEEAAETIGAAPTERYVHLYGERLQHGAVFFSRNDLKPPGRPRPVAGPPADEDPGETSADPPVSGPKPPGSRNAGDTTWSGPGDPRHGGPPTATSPPAA